MRTTGTHERVLAGAVDVAVMAAMVGGLAFSPSLRFQGIELSPAGAFFGALCAEAYALYELIHGASPAKAQLGVRLARSDGRAPKPGQLALRWTLKHVPLHAVVLAAAWLWAATDADGPFIPTVLAIAALAAAAAGSVFVFGYFLIFDGLQQALHDVLAGTGAFVIRAAARAENAFEALELGQPDAGLDDPAASVRPDPTPSRPTDGSGRSAARHATTP